MTEPIPYERFNVPMSHNFDLPDDAFRKSSRSSGQGQCVELAAVPPVVVVRDSKDKRGPVLPFDRETFKRFAAQVREGDHDL